MERQSIIRKTALGSAILGSSAGTIITEDARAEENIGMEIERSIPGKPHKGKVFVAVQAHITDVPRYAAGTVAKMINEGYTGYLIRTSNDEKNGAGTRFENILSSEQENATMAKALGFTDVFDFYYRNYRMNGISPIEIRGRLIYLFRYLKADTVLTFNPRREGEKNPDHWVTGQAVDEACWMAGNGNEYPYHMDGGVMPYTVREQYNFVASSDQPFNRIVDISSTIEQKINSIVACKSQGEGSFGSQLRKRLIKEGKHLPILGNDDETADHEYVRHFLLKKYASFDGIEKTGLEYAERFFYIDNRSQRKSEIDEYIEKNAVSL
ncbi:PIG-L deacetylase family protein [Candidatus Latescibacterota bacterium]